MSGFKKTILVDFDGVIHSYKSGWKGVDVIPDPPVDGAILWLKGMARSDDFEVCIYSSRSKDPKGVYAMESWLLEYGITDREIIKISFPTEKPPAWLTIDDRAIQFQGVFPTADEINSFKPWYKKANRGVCH